MISQQSVRTFETKPALFCFWMFLGWRPPVLSVDLLDVLQVLPVSHGSRMLKGESASRAKCKPVRGNFSTDAQRTKLDSLSGTGGDHCVKRLEQKKGTYANRVRHEDAPFRVLFWFIDELKYSKYRWWWLMVIDSLMVIVGAHCPLVCAPCFALPQLGETFSRQQSRLSQAASKPLSNRSILP